MRVRARACARARARVCARALPRYVVFMAFILLNMFLAIVNDSFAALKQAKAAQRAARQALLLEELTQSEKIERRSPFPFPLAAFVLPASPDRCPRPILPPPRVRVGARGGTRRVGRRVLRAQGAEITLHPARCQNGQPPIPGLDPKSGPAPVPLDFQGQFPLPAARFAWHDGRRTTPTRQEGQPTGCVRRPPRGYRQHGARPHQ